MTKSIHSAKLSSTEASTTEQTLLSARQSLQSLSTSIIIWLKNVLSCNRVSQSGKEWYEGPFPYLPYHEKVQKNPTYSLAPNARGTSPSHMDDIVVTLDIYKFFGHHTLNFFRELFAVSLRQKSKNLKITFCFISGKSGFSGITKVAKQ